MPVAASLPSHGSRSPKAEDLEPTSAGRGPPEKATPIDPFFVKIESWEEWASSLLPPPPNSFISNPPKVDLFCIWQLCQSANPAAKSPLPFIPRPGPIVLHQKKADVQIIGPINLFDSKPIESEEPAHAEERSSLEEVEGAIFAPVTNEEFDFDWPSEEIKKACEEMFAKDNDGSLPALNWIAPEDKTDPGGGGGEMQDIQYHRDQHYV